MNLPSLDRRAFLASVVAAAAGTAVACGSGNDAASPTTTGATTDVDAVDTPPELDLGPTPFLLGVASGDPLPDSVILWTRLVTDLTVANGGLEPTDSGVRWEVATDREFTDIATDGTSTAIANLAHSVHVDVQGLEPDTTYFYRFLLGDAVSAIGRTRTMPKDDATPERFRIGFASCQDYTEGFYAAHRAMAADELDVVFFLGDYIYETAGTGIRIPLPAKEVETLDDYRLRYASYRSDADLQACHASAPWVVTWDDHEVENNYAGLISQDNAPVEQFTARRAAAYQAYYEHMPLRLDPPTGPDFRIYRTIRCGTLAEFFVLDGRQYRTDQACNSRQDALVPKDSCPELGDADRTMLGAEQESWLSDGLEASDATWKVLAQQTVMSALVLGNLILNVDQWDGYPAARQRLLGHVNERGIDNLVVLTGDIHSAGAGVLSTDDGTPVGVEFVGTSITSSTLARIVPGGERLLTTESFPGIDYLNVTDHGYGRCTITPTEWTTEYVMVEGVDRADAPARVDATLVASAGTPALRRS